MTKQEKLEGMNPMAYVGMKGLQHKLPIDIVFEAVCEYFRIDADRLRSKTNKREVIIPRHVFFYLARQHTKCSLAYIGQYGSNEYFDFNHATVWNGVKKVKAVMPFDDEYRMAVDSINEYLENRKKGAL